MNIDSLRSDTWVIAPAQGGSVTELQLPEGANVYAIDVRGSQTDLNPGDLTLHLGQSVSAMRGGVPLQAQFPRGIRWPAYARVVADNATSGRVTVWYGVCDNKGGR